ncbi:hypothetical protein [Pantoea ananatis]|uniref:hypothetical protein n=1 Tax=Pantoea ananas TaxID=553 RepID=UPI000CF4554C|nr:hypothetical protein [Pantoea ananatis]PQK94210.1 hypothetical protein CG433_08855 [Pantoea ananatis]
MNDSIDCYVIRKNEDGINYGFLVRENGRWYYENSNLRPWKKKTALNGNHFSLLGDEKYKHDWEIDLPTLATVNWEDKTVSVGEHTFLLIIEN